jgi:uncharacterized protein YjiS (DUF1127 family)
MHRAVTRSAQSLGIISDRTPSRWSARLRSILSSRWRGHNEEAKNDSLRRLDNRLLADVGLYREHRIHNPQSRTVQQSGSAVPGALLAMWAPI